MKQANLVATDPFDKIRSQYKEAHLPNKINNEKLQEDIREFQKGQN